MLKEVQDRIAIEEVWGTRRDPLNYLPFELVESILHYLPFRELMYVFFICFSHASYSESFHRP